MIITNCAKHKTIDLGDFEHREYIPYKDLEPFYEYQLNDIKDLHNDILNAIRILFQQYSDRKITIENYNQSHDIGFSISNFINTLQFENRNLNEQIMLYVNYIAFFHISQKQYLKRIYMKFEEFYKDVENNICTNQHFSINDIHIDHTFNDLIQNTNISEDEEATVKIDDKDEETTIYNEVLSNTLSVKMEDQNTIITSKINAKMSIAPLPNSKTWDIIDQSNN
jgi:hypothetical protein